MGIKTVRTHNIYSCDGCDAEETGTSRPLRWGKLTFERAAEDIHGNLAADATIRRTLCPECSITLAAAINKAFI